MKKEVITDPVCGMEVDKRSALMIKYMNKRYYFCSEDCKIKFEKAPETYSTRRSTKSHKCC